MFLQGCYVGVVWGGVSCKMILILQSGSQVDLYWCVWFEEYIGFFIVEFLCSRVEVFSDCLFLVGLNVVIVFLGFVLLECELYEVFYVCIELLLDFLGQKELWFFVYLCWEIVFLEVFGYGFDFSSCVVMGVIEGLIYIFLKFGWVVFKQGVGEWVDWLLLFVLVLVGEGEGFDEEVL